MIQPYLWERAVQYAHEWAYSRNPRFYNYDQIGGDCTNFVSQCVYAGSGVMNDTPTFGWYYINGNLKSPSWTGVEYFYRFMTREIGDCGPVGRACSVRYAQPGDVIQLSFDGIRFTHSLLVVSDIRTIFLSEKLVAAHSDDTDDRSLSSYQFKKARCIHITGVRV